MAESASPNAQSIYQPKVSVIIPVYNNAEGLKQTLAALKQQDYAGELEIIVVDNNSTDGSDQVAAAVSGVSVIYERSIQNSAAARNRGIAVATGEILTFTDSDCIPLPTWISQAVKAMHEQQIDRGAGEIAVRPIAPDSSAAALLDVVYYFYPAKAVEQYGAALGANNLIRREVFAKVGLFNARMDELEDIEFGLRASAAGSSIGYAAEAGIIHPPRTTVAALWRKSWRYGHGIFSLCQQNPAWAGRWGWKHPVRVLRIILKPRSLYWERLPFSANQISWQKRLQVYWLLWYAVHWAEAIGYLDEWQQWLSRKQFLEQ